jgi:hypothetical protein
MVLGVYWYYGFPAGLYHFDYFSFHPGLGGHADGPAELNATVQVPHPAALLRELQAVAVASPEAPLFAYSVAQTVCLKTGGYGLHDYSFHLAEQVEQRLRQHGATRTADEQLPHAPAMQRLGPAPPAEPFPTLRLLQVVSTRAGQYQAEALLLRLDCRLPRARRAAFVQQLDALSQQADLDVLYYLDHELAQQTNLMVFFGNGRQGVNGQPLRRTDAAALEAAVQQALQAHGGQPGHLGRFPQEYPRRGPHPVRLADADFVL